MNDESGGAAGGAADGSRRRRNAWHALAFAIFAAATLALYAELFSAGFSSHVTLNARSERGGALRPREVAALRGDAVFGSWLVARNARALWRDPLHFFDADHCAPAEKAISSSDPVLSLGVLGMPAALIAQHPTPVYNSALLALRMLMSLAMYALILHWTGVPAAALSAGLLYAFHPAWLRDATHAFLYDTSWTLLALLFLSRLLLHGRWRDAIGLAAAAALQIGTSFYAIVASALVGLPCLAWLLRRHGLRRLRPAQAALIATGVAASMALVLGPYLQRAREQEGVRALRRSFADWSMWAPDGALFPGLPMLLLCALALAPAARLVCGGRAAGMRAPLLLGGLLSAAVAVGANQPAPLPDLYAALGALLPGFDSVRAPLRISMGAHLSLSVLAGIGAALIVLRLSRPRQRAAAGAALITLTALAVLAPDRLGLAPRVPFDLLETAPEPEALAFFDTLGSKGEPGAMLELPLYVAGDRSGPRTVSLHERATRVARSWYHERRTSACYGSQRPPGRRELERLSLEVPAREALAALADLGFSTLVVREAEASGLRARLDAAAAAPNGALRLAHATPERAGYTIALDAAARPAAKTTRASR